MSQLTTGSKDNERAELFVYGVEIDPSFGAEVEKRCGERAVQCYQCGECTAGCPAAFAMELTPNKIMRMVQIGAKKPVLESSTIWLCAGCETCATRCPRGLSVAKVMDACREMAHEEGVRSPQSNVTIFHNEFLSGIERTGRVNEAFMIAFYKLKSRDFFSDIPLGIKMFLKGKLAIIPSSIKGVGEVKKIFRKTAAK